MTREIAIEHILDQCSGFPGVRKYARNQLNELLRAGGKRTTGTLIKPNEKLLKQR